MVLEDLKTFDVRDTGLDSKLAKSERKRKQFDTKLGEADPVFCVSCCKPFGFASIGSDCIIICNDCQFKKYSLPLQEMENTAKYCEFCKKNYASVPRDIVDKIIYYCEGCEKILESKPPLQQMPPEEARALGIKEGLIK